MKSNNRIIEYDIIRVIATILVVIGHAGYLSMVTSYGGIDTIIFESNPGQRLIDYAIRFIYSFHMPLFFFLSGAVFNNAVLRGKYKGVTDVILDKSKRLLVPYIAATALYVVPIKYAVGYYSKSPDVIYDIVVGQLFITGNTHLWFLIVLFEITILSYIIISLKCNSTIKVLIVVAIDLFGIFVDIPFMGISRMCINSVWFLLGYYFNERREKIYGFIYSKKSVVGILLLYSVTMFLYLTMFKGNQLIYQLVNFGGIATTLIITLIIRKYDFFYTNKCFRVILKASFAIYILSDPLNYIILYTAGRDCIGIPFSSSINCLALALLRSVLTLIFPIVIYTFYGKAKQKIKNR